MSTRFWQALAVILAAIIIVLVWLLFALPTPHTETPPPVATSTSASTTTFPATSTVPNTSTTSEPLHAQVIVSSPASGATVGQSFTILGQAPGAWFSEAVFPIKVLDKDSNVIGATQAQAGGDWMTAGEVPFAANVQLDGSYHGAATVVLMRDNPSGLPENDDALEVPIVIQ